MENSSILSYLGWIVMPSEPYLCSFKRVCKTDMGGSLQSGSRTFWCRQNSGSTAKSFLLVEASKICPHVHQILHCLCHFQAHHQETGAIHLVIAQFVARSKG
jgi:hypothetical protein